MLVSLAVFITAFSSTTGQIPTLSLSPNPVELGQNYTLVCTVSINSAINFIRSGNNEGSCPPPFLGTPCTPPEITQNSDKTSWIRTSTSTNDEGSWTCVRSTSVSNVVSLDMFACADNVMSESGINSNVTLNETSAITISVKIGCIYPSAASINLMLKPSSSSIPPFKMSCTADTLPCTIGSAYECTHEIAGNVTSDEGEYTVHVEGLPTIGNCSNSLQLFDGYYIKFKQNQGAGDSTDSEKNVYIVVGVCAAVVVGGGAAGGGVAYTKKKGKKAESTKDKKDSPSKDKDGKKMADAVNEEDKATLLNEKERKRKKTKANKSKKKKGRSNDKQDKDNVSDVKVATTTHVNNVTEKNPKEVPASSLPSDGKAATTTPVNNVTEKNPKEVPALSFPSDGNVATTTPVNNVTEVIPKEVTASSLPRKNEIEEEGQKVKAKTGKDITKTSDDKQDEPNVSDDKIDTTLASNVLEEGSKEVPDSSLPREGITNEKTAIHKATTEAKNNSPSSRRKSFDNIMKNRVSPVQDDNDQHTASNGVQAKKTGRLEPMQHSVPVTSKTPLPKIGEKTDNKKK